MHLPAAFVLALLALRGRCDDNAAAERAAFNTVVQGITPHGLRIAVPDAPGVRTVTIAAGVNAPIDKIDRPPMLLTITEAKNGYWTLEEKLVLVEPNDVVFLTISLVIDNKEQRAHGRSIIRDLVEPYCQPSPTTVNGVPACKGQPIFEDNFDTFNKKIWKHTIQFSGDPDGEFSTYDSRPENVYVKNGSMHIVATPMDNVDVTQPRKLYGCTWHRQEQEYCERNPVGWQILPPVNSGWINTQNTFSFKYGRIEARVRAADGDWLYSRFFLEGNERAYGAYPFESGQMSIMRVRGNADFVEPNGYSTGARRSNTNLGIATCHKVLHIGGDRDLQGEERFTDSMHLQSATWTPEFIRIDVDGEHVKTMRPPDGGFIKYDFLNVCDSPWKKGDIMAPFDREMYLNFGLEVGGRALFPDNGTSNGVTKPWRDTDPKIFLQFWKARDDWAPTWKGSLEVDYVKVWAL